MAIVLNGDTGISSIGTLTGVTSISSASANTPVIMQDSDSNSNTCRAWVNFDGTGTVAIRASFNVSSITDNGAGLYTVNMTTAMPDVGYTINVSTGGSSFTNLSSINASASAIIAPTTSAFRIYSYSRGSATANDAEYINVSVFR